MEFGKYLKPKSLGQLDVNTKIKNLKSKSDAKAKIVPLKEPLLEPFGVPPMGWMPREKITYIMADRDAELRAKTKQD